MPDKKIELRVISPTSATDKSPFKFHKEVDMVIMRCVTGDLGVLPGRIPCSTVLGSGLLRIFDGENESRMTIEGGVAQVGNDIVTILSDSVTEI